MMGSFERGFAWAVSYGTIVGIGIGLGVLLTILIASGNAETDIETSFVVFGAAAFLNTGGVLIGALSGIVAGRRSGSSGGATAAGFISGALSNFIVLLMLFLAVALVASARGGFGASTGPAEPFEWGQFAKALLTLIPAGITGAICAAASMQTDDPTGGLVVLGE